MIFVSQIAKVLGVSIDKAPIPQTLVALLQSLDDIHWATFGVALVTLAILIFLPRVTRRVPAALVAVILSIAASALLNLESIGVALVGDIPSGLPSLTMPDIIRLEVEGDKTHGWERVWKESPQTKESGR